MKSVIPSFSATHLDIRLLMGRQCRRLIARANTFAILGHRLRFGGGIGVLLVATLFADPVLAQYELAAITGWRIEKVDNVPTTRGLVQRDEAPPRQLRLLLDRQYPVLDRRTWIEVDGHRLGPARYSEDLRSLSAALPGSIHIGPESRITIADPDGMARSSSNEKLKQAIPWKPPMMKILEEDPASAGPYQVEQLDYWLGDEAFEFDYLPSEKRRGEMKARIYVPKNVEHPAPVVLFLHGMHATCYVDGGDVSEAWPCRAPSKPLDSYLGYGAAGRALASHGYIVVSISANGINAHDWQLGRWARASLLRAHLDYLAVANLSGTPELGNQLVGKLDLQRIGVMGHSRGGEGAVQAAIDANGGVGRFKFKAVFGLAPTNFEEARVPGPALAVMLPYCDGDVMTQVGQSYIEASRHVFGDNMPRTAVIAHGANHNFFNSMWTTGSPGAWDDGARRGDFCLVGTYYRLKAEEQLRVGAAYIAAFFRLNLGGEQQFAPLFDGSATQAPGKAIVQSVATAPTSQRLDVATFEWNSEAVSHQGWEAEYCVGSASTESPEKPLCAARHWFGGLPHWYVRGSGDMLRLNWINRTGQTKVLLPQAAGDVSGYAVLSLRAMPSEAIYGLPAPDLAITLVDQQGKRSTVRISEVSDALASLPGFSVYEQIWILRGVQIPLSSFHGLNLREITSIELAPASNEGEVFLSDLAFVR